MTKNSVSHTSYLRNHTSYDHHLWYASDNISRHVFHFLKILIFQVVKRVKGKRIAQTDKKLLMFCLISQEPYIIVPSFMLHMWKRIISPGIFHIFSKLKFLGSTVGCKAKKWPKMTKKICLPYSISQEAYTI